MCILIREQLEGDRLAMFQIGLLGAGYVGKYLLRAHLWHPDSWYTVRPGKPKIEELTGTYQGVTFDWRDEGTWECCPHQAEVILLTIPPALKNVNQEAERLQNWCQWVKENRPQWQRLIYISSTGVYPNLNGTWCETDDLDPDTLNAHLRILTERALGNCFQVQVIRPGGIYGPGRHLGIRIAQRKPIPEMMRPVHRIHVADLTQLIHLMVDHPEYGPCINAVDQDASASKVVALWLMEQSFIPKGLGRNLAFSAETRFYQGAASPLKRKISNRFLVERLHFHYHFPTFREGLSALYAAP